MKTPPKPSQGITPEVIGASEFKRRCLELLEIIRRRGREFVITKRGVAIARVVPIRRGSLPLRGSMKDRLVIRGDIVHVDWTEEWESLK